MPVRNEFGRFITTREEMSVYIAMMQLGRDGKRVSVGQIAAETDMSERDVRAALDFFVSETPRAKWKLLVVENNDRTYCIVPKPG